MQMILKMMLVLVLNFILHLLVSRNRGKLVQEVLVSLEVQVLPEALEVLEVLEIPRLKEVRGGQTNNKSGAEPNSEKWKSKLRSHKRRFQYEGHSGVKVMPDNPNSPMSIFKTFFTDELVQHLVDATNTYADIIINTPEIQTKIQQSVKSLFKLWKPNTVDEM